MRKSHTEVAKNGRSDERATWLCIVFVICYEKVERCRQYVYLYGLCTQQSADDQTKNANRLRRSLNRQQATPGEYFRYKQRGADDVDTRVGRARLTSRRQSQPYSSAMSDLLKRNWDDIAMSAWG